MSTQTVKKSSYRKRINEREEITFIIIIILCSLMARVFHEENPRHSLLSAHPNPNVPMYADGFGWTEYAFLFESLRACQKVF